MADGFEVMVPLPDASFQPKFSFPTFKGFRAQFQSDPRSTPGLWVSLRRLWGESRDTPPVYSEKASSPVYRRLSDIESAISDSDASSSSTVLHLEPKTATSKVDARVVSDAIIGLSDGLTVPFALTAGLSALGSTRVVIYGGLAELIAGAISMGLGGFLAAKSEEAAYKATLTETRDQIATDPASVQTDIASAFSPYGIPTSTVEDLTAHLTQSPMLVSFLMQFHHALAEPHSSRALMSALTIALGYFLGGFVPLIPYFFVGIDEAPRALLWSIGIMAFALFVFGYVKTGLVAGWGGTDKVRKAVLGGLLMILVGGVAAGSAMGIIKCFHYLGGNTV